MKTSIFDIFRVGNDELLAIETISPDVFAYIWHILEEVVKLHTPVLKWIGYIDGTG